ncbi:two-component system, OmpR family, sensor histidine kinase CpxA [Colwellia chukchiensis]|uniref:histidine kinase n=1 Tax=Colwellia chukchiensis TaxID=641665 RepID=A0A1H7T6S8_9GAMM|nr:ATP-binding protein [Colwellia chukchiensis]SEL80590.1 two-component system, OmpR family, sensor histidine kinase CpxA [Colwellia chukchiensis]
MLAITRKFSALGVKLFIYFWLVLIGTFAVTKLLSAQFSSKSVIVPTHKGDAMRIERITQNINNLALKTPQSIYTLLPNRQARAVLVKNTTSNQVYFSGAASLANVADFVGDNKLTRLSTIKFKFYRLTGPQVIDIDGASYQLFIASRDGNRHFNNMLHRVPAWLAVTTALVISALLLWLLSRSLTKPLIALQKATAKFGDGDLSTRMPLIAQRHDEIGACAASFNAMADKLEHNIDAHQRLLADVSHELRSPMTRLQIALGLAQQTNIDAATREKHLQRCEREVARLDEMISNVLSLSRLENTISAMTLMMVDLEQLIRLCIEDAQYIANNKAIKIKFTPSANPLIQADANLLSSAISNILLNAITYSAPQGQLAVELRQTQRHIIINIIDSGIGVPTADLAKLFEPFYRVAPARDRATGGTGLGLAIAKQAIVAHHGRIFAQNNPQQGLTVTIELPVDISKNSPHDD